MKAFGAALGRELCPLGQMCILERSLFPASGSQRGISEEAHADVQVREDSGLTRVGVM